MRWLGVLLVLAGAARAAGPLEIVNAVFEQGDGGSPLPPGTVHVPGEMLFLRFQVQGYQAVEQRIQLRYRIEAADPQGVAIMPPVEQPIAAELAPEDKQWKPGVRREIPVPPLSNSGIYSIRIKVTDEIAKAEATREVFFTVRGRNVALSDTLVVRNFHFYREEDSPNALEKAAYRAGDTVWAKFDITGYKYGPGNKVDVAYDVAVLSTEGKVLWSQPDAAVERSESFYPKRYVPGSMSLNLQAGIKPAQYALRVTVRDAVGGQTTEAVENFTVE